MRIVHTVPYSRTWYVIIRTAGSAKAPRATGCGRRQKQPPQPQHRDLQHRDLQHRDLQHRDLQHRAVVVSRYRYGTVFTRGSERAITHTAVSGPLTQSLYIKKRVSGYRY
jgi:hypothetical protein